MAGSENPFADPSVKDASRPLFPVQDEDFNPFSRQQPWPGAAAAEVPAANSSAQWATIPATQPPATLEPSTAPPPAYTSWENSAAADDLRRRQEELERKAEELQRREQEIQRNMQFQNRQNNFPPLPGWFPLKPCFYQDISMDIPVEFQKLVRMAYYFWLAYSGLLIVNCLGALTYLIAASQHGGSGNAGSTFGVSLLFLALFIPCSFVCWFRPAYNAFQKDSSFNFFIFFFIFFFQFCVLIFQCLGIDGWGTVGFLNSFGMLGNSAAGAKAAGVIMFFIGVMFAAAAAASMLLLLKVHRIYRSTGASFAKAQQEFSQNVMSNRSVQTAVGNMASSAARATVEQSMGTNRPNTSMTEHATPSAG